MLGVAPRTASRQDGIKGGRVALRRHNRVRGLAIIIIIISIIVIVIVFICAIIITILNIIVFVVIVIVASRGVGWRFVVTTAPVA